MVVDIVLSVAEKDVVADVKEAETIEGEESRLCCSKKQDNAIALVFVDCG